MVAAGRLTPTDVSALLVVVAPLFIAGSAIGLVSFTSLAFAMGWLINVVPGYGSAIRVQLA
jgi:hypothetical protein